MNEGRYTFIVDIPPRFQSDLSRGVSPTVELIADATAMSQAGRGPEYLKKIILQESKPFFSDRGNPWNSEIVKLNTRARFNPNMQQSWFVAVNQIINNIFRSGHLPDRRGRTARAVSMERSSTCW